jgi:hypothetical protein
MKKIDSFLSVTIITITFVAFTSCKSTKNMHKTPAKEDILQTMRRTNQYFMDKWPTLVKAIFTNIERTQQYLDKSRFITKD